MSKRILFVDDDEGGIRDELKISLEKRGYCVETAGDGDGAIALLKSKRFDLIITDCVRMKMMRGGSFFLEELREFQRKGEISRDIWVISYTGHLDSKTLIRLLKTGVNDFVPKPEIPELFSAVEKGFEEMNGIREEMATAELEISEEDKRKAQDFNWLAENSLRLQKEYPGKYVAIINKEIIGIGDSYSEAYKEARGKFPEINPFLAMIPDGRGWI